MTRASNHVDGAIHGVCPSGPVCTGMCLMEAALGVLDEVVRRLELGFLRIWCGVQRGCAVDGLFADVAGLIEPRAGLETKAIRRGGVQALSANHLGIEVIRTSVPDRINIKRKFQFAMMNLVGLRHLALQRGFQQEVAK